MEKSWTVYLQLETFKDGFGGWDILGVLGKPVIDLPETLVNDLITWRFLSDKVQEEISKKKKAKDGN